MNVRSATLEDAQGIAKVHVDTWRTTYEGIIPSEFLAKLSYEQRTMLWQQNIAKEDNTVFIIENDKQQIIGFGDTCRRANNIDLKATDLTSLYLLQSYQGKGLGRLLLKALFTRIKNEGYEKVFVEVLEDNPTRYFYEYFGAQFVKTVPITIGGQRLNESIYVWPSVDEVLRKLNRE
jgi:ribosomal protein S18 acetylase RimI-like enzyme